MPSAVHSIKLQNLSIIKDKVVGKYTRIFNLFDLHSAKEGTKVKQKLLFYDRILLGTREVPAWRQ